MWFYFVLPAVYKQHNSIEKLSQEIHYHCGRDSFSLIMTGNRFGALVVHSIDRIEATFLENNKPWDLQIA